MSEYRYYEAKGSKYRGQLKKIKKSSNYLQPIFEALTNSLESIKSSRIENGKIEILLDFGGNLFSGEKSVKSLQSIEILDNGDGFTNEAYERMEDIHDDTKGYSNKGSGRLQFIHFFEEVIYKSIFKENSPIPKLLERNFKLSKSEDFLNHNAILSYKEPTNIENDTGMYTKLILKNLIDNKDTVKYSHLTPKLLKQEILYKYLEYFASNRENLPVILIKSNYNNEIESITSEDIVNVNKEDFIEVSYKKFNGKDYIKTEKKEKLIIKAFVINQKLLNENSIRLTSKREIITNNKIAENITLNSLKPAETINSNRYLFLISGDYIDGKDVDNRGELELYTEKEAKETLNKDDELILLDDINYIINKKILSMYEEIGIKQQKHKENLEKLKEMFLLNKETLKKLKNKININDTDESILKKVYKADVEIIAEKDARIKEKIEQLDTLNLSSSSQEDYQEQFNANVKELVEVIPLQNRTALTHAVARRKLVLELFYKILNRELDVQNPQNRNNDEELLHNLIFSQKSQDTDKSNLWLINEDYIHFKGTSESRLEDIKINGEKILKEDSSLSEEELQIKLSLGKNRGTLRTDVLLFPEEGKCIILEFKNPNVDVSKHLLQINNYATLILNFTKNKYKFHTFYGYFIGETMNDFDIRSCEPTFKEVPNESGFNYWKKPVSPIVGYFGNEDAQIFLEIIKFSTIFERAKLRNTHYIDKLLEGDVDENTI